MVAAKPEVRAIENEPDAAGCHMRHSSGRHENMLKAVGIASLSCFKPNVITTYSLVSAIFSILTSKLQKVRQRQCRTYITERIENSNGTTVIATSTPCNLYFRNIVGHIEFLVLDDVTHSCR